MENFFSATNYIIIESDQRPRVSGTQLSKNINFKNEFAKFLLTEWQKYEYADITGSKKLTVSHGGNCVAISFSAGSNMHVLNSSKPDELQATHEEADTLIGYHVSKVLNCSARYLYATRDIG